MSGELRAVFDEDPELYDRARPGYPGPLLTELAALAGIGPGSRVLELGPGTGQATLALAQLGARVTAVELGAGLARVLAERVAGHSVEVVVSAFEDWPLPAEPFDAVVSFTAWHWFDPALRAVKVAAALAPGGRLATVTTEHMLGGSTEFFAQVQNCYLRWDPATPPGLRLRAADEFPPFLDEVDRPGLFRPAVRRRYEQELRYRRSEYLDVLNTYSGHRALPPDQHQGLFDAIAALIDDHHGGMITKRYLYELRVAELAG